MKKISLCIPTKNRSSFLGRLLCSLAEQKFLGHVLIGDSSDDNHFEQTREWVKTFQSILDIRHEKCPNMSDAQAIEYLCQYIDTPYSTMICDDDFICVKGMNECIAFLDSHSDYGAAHGLSVMISLDKSGPYGNLANICSWPLATLEAGTGAERLREFFKYSRNIIFCVHRTAVWVAMHSGFSQMKGARQGFIFGELIASSIAAVGHKVKSLDCLHVIRQSHDAIYHQVPLYQWLTDPEWFLAYSFFRQKIIEALMEKDKITSLEAKKIFEMVFQDYLSSYFNSVVRKQKTNTILSRLISKENIKKIPVVPKVYRFLRSRFHKPFARLQKRYPFLQNDFLPILRAVQNFQPLIND